MGWRHVRWLCVWVVWCGNVGVSFAGGARGADSRWSLAKARQFHRGGVVLDLHADTLYQLMRGWVSLRRRQAHLDVDIPKMRLGGLSAQVFVMWVPPGLTKKPGSGWRYLRKMHRVYRRMIRDSRGVFVHARTATQIRKIHREGKIAALLAIEGLHPLEGRWDRLNTLLGWGPAYAGLTWNNSNAFATSAKDERRGIRRKRGLTAKGRRLMRVLEKHRVLIDVSHASRKTFWDVAKFASRPWIASHSNVDALRKHFRNLTDRQLRMIARRGGLVGINFYTAYLRAGRAHRKAKLKDLIHHLEYMRKIMGEGAIALGSDFDGMITKPRGLSHCGLLPKLTQKLRARGWSKNTLRKFLGGNVLRLLDHR